MWGNTRQSREGEREGGEEKVNLFKCRPSEQALKNLFSPTHRANGKASALVREAGINTSW